MFEMIKLFLQTCHELHNIKQFRAIFNDQSMQTNSAAKTKRKENFHELLVIW